METFRDRSSPRRGQDGYSLARIAKKLNADGLPPPRVTARRRQSGSKDSSVRAILHNQTCVGRWSFKEKGRRKLPGTILAGIRSEPRQRCGGKMVISGGSSKA